MSKKLRMKVVTTLQLLDMKAELDKIHHKLTRIEEEKQLSDEEKKGSEKEKKKKEWTDTPDNYSVKCGQIKVFSCSFLNSWACARHKHTNQYIFMELFPSWNFFTV